LDFYGASTEIDATSGVGTRRSPVSIYTLRLGGQMPVSQTLHLRGSLARITTGEKSENSPGTDLTIDSGPQTELAVALVHEWSDNMAFQFKLAKRLEADSGVKVGDVQSRDISSDSFAVAVSALMTF